MLKIGIIKNKIPQGGPQIFMNRLLRSIINQKLANVINAKYPFFDIGLYSSVAKNIYHKKYVLRIDGIYYDLDNTVGNNDILNETIFKSIDNASGIIFQSQFSKKLVEKFYGKIDKPYEIIFNGTYIPTEDPLKKREDYDIPSNKIIFVASARWRRWKRLREITEIFMELNLKYKDLFLLVLGNNPDYTIKNDRIKYLGDINNQDLTNILQLSDGMFHLAWLDNCPNTVVEGIACGIPVLCSNQGGTKELIVSTDGGIISAVDEKFKYEQVKLYEPPSMDMSILYQDGQKFLNNLHVIKAKINKQVIDIDFISSKYVNFINTCY